MRRCSQLRSPPIAGCVTGLARQPRIAGTLPFGFRGGKRDHRTLDREKLTLAIAACPQRPTDMSSQRRVEQRVADTAEGVAVGIRRLYEHWIGHALDRRLD